MRFIFCLQKMRAFFNFFYEISLQPFPTPRGVFVELEADALVFYYDFNDFISFGPKL